MTGIVVLDFIIGLCLGLLLLWPGLLLTLVVLKPRKAHLREAVRLLPDMLVMLRSMARDKEQRLVTRAQARLLLVYVASPIDLVPDFLPGIGMHDDAIVANAVLRAIVRRDGVPTLRTNWRGSEEALESLTRLCATEAGRGRVPDFDPTLPLNHPQPPAEQGGEDPLGRRPRP